MSSIILPGRFTSQPQYAATVSQSGIGAKARFALLGSQTFELVSGVARAGTIGTLTPTSGGLAYVLPSANTTWTKVAAQLDPYVSGSFSVFWRGVIRYDTLQTLLSYGSTSVGWEFKTDGWAPGQIRLRLDRIFNGAGPATGPIGVVDGSIHSVALVYDDAAATVEFFWDDVSVGSSGFTKDGGAAGSTAFFAMKGDATSPHKMITAQAFAGKLSTAEISALTANPWQIFKAPARHIFPVSASADKTASITGQSLTSSQGTLSPSTSVALSGQSLTSSQGTLSPGTAKALSGQSLTSSQGTLVPSTSVRLTGQALTSSQGTLSTNGDVTLALSGQTLTSSQGTLAPATTVAISGQSLTSAQGSVSPATSVSLSGQSLTGSQGNLAPSSTGQSITIQLTGQSLTAYQGSFSLEEYIWDTDAGRAGRSRGTFRPLEKHYEPEVVVVDIPEEESTYEHHPIEDVKPIQLGPKVGLSGVRLPRAAMRPKVSPPAPSGRDYRALMARAGKPQKTIKLSDFPITKNKKYLTKTRGPATLKGN